MKLRWALATVAFAVGGVIPLTAVSCGTVASPLSAAGQPLPPLTAAPARAGSTAPSSNCGDATLSSRPPVTMPIPGKMPAGSYLAAIAKRGYLRVAVNVDVPPFGSVDPDSGQFAGFDVRIAEAVGRAIFGASGHVKYRAVTNAERIPAIRDGDVDIVVATMTVNCERRTQVDFSAVYYEAGQRVLVLNSSPAKSLGDLGGQKVCAPAGTTSIQRIAQAPSRPVPYPVTNDSDCLVAMQNGQVAAISTDDEVLAGMQQQDPQTRVLPQSLAPEPLAVAISLQHPDLTRFVNGVLARIKADGEWTAIYQQTVGNALGPTPAPPPNRYRN
ncbi:MAG: glutamate ABC transporter substrate-binding protein [Frankia sp.]